MEDCRMCRPGFICVPCRRKAAEAQSERRRDYNARHLQGQLQAVHATQEQADYGAYRCNLCSAEATENGGVFVTRSGRAADPDPNPKAPKTFYCTECIEQLAAVAHHHPDWDRLTESHYERGLDAAYCCGPH